MTVSPSRRSLALFFAVWFVLSLLFVGACRFTRSPAAPGSPAGSSSADVAGAGPSIERLRAALAVARPLATGASLACLPLNPADRERCRGLVGALREGLQVADQVLAAAEACAEGDQRCAELSAQAAEEAVPRLLDLVAQLEQLAASPGASRREAGGSGGAGRAGGAGLEAGAGGAPLGGQGGAGGGR